MKVLITGITGLIGTELAINMMKNGHSVYGISRSKTFDVLPKKRLLHLDIENDDLHSDTFSGYDIIIHLAGHPVAQEAWTAKVKESIYRSRVLSTQKIVTAINQLPNDKKPKHFICGSAIGIYGQGFLAETTKDWEKEAQKIKNVPLTTLRTGIVLSRKGGALQEMPPVVVGNGQMLMSWIHITDWVKALDYIIHHQLYGPVDLTAPSSIMQKDFVSTLVKAQNGPLKLWTPLAVLKLALGERADVLFESIDVKPKALLNAGFSFDYPTLDLALAAIYPDRHFLNKSKHVVQFVQKDINTIFDFFSDASNLEKITPPFLNFKIKSMSTDKVEKGSIIDYTLKLHGIPFGWRTLISHWDVNKCFVDEQLKGPYSHWHHTHSFYEVDGGTLIVDDVIFRLPMGVLGLVALPFVKKDVQSIFKYRVKIIDELFNKKGT